MLARKGMYMCMLYNDILRQNDVFHASTSIFTCNLEILLKLDAGLNSINFVAV